jgi:hypothetical protein
MASIFFTEFASRLFLDFQIAARLNRCSGAQTFRCLRPGELPGNTRDYVPSSAGFLKSRVYAKLLTASISECYQTFNGQAGAIGRGRRMIRQPMK